MIYLPIYNFGYSIFLKWFYTIDKVWDILDYMIYIIGTMLKITVVPVADIISIPFIFVYDLLAKYIIFPFLKGYVSLVFGIIGFDIDDACNEKRENTTNEHCLLEKSVFIVITTIMIIGVVINNYYEKKIKKEDESLDEWRESLLDQMGDEKKEN